MSIVIVDNGKGADKLQQLIPDSKVIPAKDYKKAMKEKADAFILTDGTPSKIMQDCVVDILETTKVPVLAIGASYLFLGSLIGADVVKTKPIKGKLEIKVKHGCPMTTDMKKISVTYDIAFKLENIPEEIMTIAPSEGGEIIQDIELPLIGVSFLPEDSDDGPKMIKNFLSFVEIYDQYHKN